MEYEAVRQRHVAALLAAIPASFERLGWPAERLAAERTRRLRDLVAHAQAHSPWHGERLRDVDAATLTEETLAEAVPVMTKAEMMDHFDDVVTDRRITLETVERHLDGLQRDAYLFDTYHVVASGGSSGRRSIMVWDWDGWVECFLSLGRRSLVRRPPTGAPNVVAGVSALKASHMSAAIIQTFSSPQMSLHPIPATLPLPTIVERLNAVTPTTLQGYPSVLHRLALEQQAGRLRIAPASVITGSEALLPESRALMEAAWGVTVENGYGASEVGGISSACGQGPWMHLNDEYAIVEVVDDDGKPVSPGTAGARIFVTGLMNKVMPVIRYELDDRVMLLDQQCPCGSAHRVVGDIHGRTGEVFRFGPGAEVHPAVFSGVLGADHAVVEYQVRQTAAGIEVDVVADRSVDTEDVRTKLAQSLADAGAPGVAVTVAVVPDIPRQASGKIRRFVPVPAEVR